MAQRQQAEGIMETARHAYERGEMPFSTYDKLRMAMADGRYEVVMATFAKETPDLRDKLTLQRQLGDLEAQLADLRAVLHDFLEETRGSAGVRADTVRRARALLGE
jgi:hypothetical protein